MNRALLLGAILVALQLVVSSARAQGQKEASEAFAACRDMEQHGDATPCWRRWLEKHQTTGTAAEIELAQSRVKEANPPPSNAAIATEPSTEDTEQEPAQVATTAPPGGSGLDLCARASDANDKKQRVTIFAIAGASALNEDPQLARAEASRHLNEGFLEHFGAERFHSVTTTLAGKSAWATATELSLDSVHKTFASKADREVAKELEQAIGCSQYLVFTTLTRFNARGQASALTVELGATMGLFRVNGSRATLVKSFTASVPSPSDPAENSAAERSSVVCEQAQESQEQTALLSCEIRVRAEQLAITFREAAAEELPATQPDAPASGKLGLGLQLYATGAFTLGAQDHRFPRLIEVDGDPTTREAQFFEIPSLMMGGGAVISYDLSGLISLPDSAVRLGADVLVGQGRATQASQIATELAFEKGFPLAPRLELYAGLGGSLSLIMLRSVPDYDPVPLDGGGAIPGQVIDMSATRFGALGLLGIEFLLMPNLGIRAEGTFRYNIAQEGYASPNPSTAQCPVNPYDPASPVATDPAQFPNSLFCWGFDRRNDSWTAAGVRVGAIMMF